MTRESEVDFGFERVAPEEKARRVRGVFSSVASRYDVMNDVMSAGVHRLWKDAMIAWMSPRSGARLIDVAGGTGDIARRFLAAAGATGEALICDATPDMLIEGRARAASSARLQWVCGRAEALPVAAGGFDAYSIAFGMRNIADRAAALAEARRVLKPGGRFMCLEFAPVEAPVFDRLYDLYSFNVIPALGEFVTGDRASYQYLVESIRRFPKPDAFLREIRASGLERAKFRRLTGGVAVLWSAWRL